MLRLLIVLGVLFLLYVLIRKAVREWNGEGSSGTLLGKPDHMIQDPVCRTYVPRGTAISERIGGQTYYFCSQDCAQTFQKQLSH